MGSRIWQGLVFFFTRPIRLSDVSALASRMKPRPRIAPVTAASAEPIVVPVDTVPVATAPLARERKPPRADAGPSVSSMFHPELAIGVSEQPIDTLPAELRDELQRPSTGRLQGSLASSAGLASFDKRES